MTILQLGTVSQSSETSTLLRSALGLAELETPFPWQEELLKRFINGVPVGAVDIPTGLGKTSVMAIWLVARVVGAKLPRRLVYVVDRRAVVDQATEVAERLREWVTKERGAADALGLGDRPLPISTLRGQHVDNRAWLEDPSLPAIIIGTVDMVGSRLLFSGYGVSPKMRPYHAGLLGCDSLVVLDEAHLVPAFEDLLRQIDSRADLFGPNESSLCELIPKFRLLSLSATGRKTETATLPLSDEDRRHPIVNVRLTAKKALTIIDLAAVSEDNSTPDDGESSDDADEASQKNKGPKLSDALAKEAWQLATQYGNIRCLVFCDARKDALAVADALKNLAKSASEPEPAVELFVGGRRVKERVQARDALAQLGFLAGTDVTLERAVFLIATSAGEVGVDLDADHMVCDLVAWERMVQRLGRVNRRGEGDAKVVVVVGKEPAPSKARAREALEEKLSKRDAAIQAFRDRPRLQSEIAQLEAADHPESEELATLRDRIQELDEQIAANKIAKKAIPTGKKSTLQDKVLKESLEREGKALVEDRKAARERLKLFEKEVKSRLKEDLAKRLTPLKDTLKKCEENIKAFKDSDAKSVAQHEAKVAQYHALRKLLDTVAGSGGCLSPAALLTLRDRQDLADALQAATTVEPLRPELTRPLVDAWSMTSLDEHPGRPEVDPWLRGFRPNDPPQTTVVWRRHLPVRTDGTFDAKAAKRFFEAAPPHTSEQLETDTYLVREWLISRSGKFIKTVDDATAKKIFAIGLSSRGEVKQWWPLKTLAHLKGDEAKKLDSSLTGLTLIVDARLGGLNQGLLSTSDDESLVKAKQAADKAAEAAVKSVEKAKEKVAKAESAAQTAEEKLQVAQEKACSPNANEAARKALAKAEENMRKADEAVQAAKADLAEAEHSRSAAVEAKEKAETELVQSSIAGAADDNSNRWLENPDFVGVPVTGFRIRHFETDEHGDLSWSRTRDVGWVRRYTFVLDDVDGEPSEVLAIDGWSGDAATEDERAEADTFQQLGDHQRAVAECAKKIAQGLHIGKDYEDLLVLAATLHDEGKRAERWQRAFKAPADGGPFAKTIGPINFDLLDGYRHELGSLSFVKTHEDFKRLCADDQDFVLHLIAAHHGFARPLIGASGCDDAPPSIVGERAREVALRFASLSRRWGPWRLAWWESLLRASDQIASRRIQQVDITEKERAQL